MPPKNSQSQGTKAKPKAAAKEEKKEAKVAKTAPKGKFADPVLNKFHYISNSSYIVIWLSLPPCFTEKIISL